MKQGIADELFDFIPSQDTSQPPSWMFVLFLSLFSVLVRFIRDINTNQDYFAHISQIISPIGLIDSCFPPSFCRDLVLGWYLLFCIVHHRWESFIFDASSSCGEWTGWVRSASWQSPQEPIVCHAHHPPCWPRESPLSPELCCISSILAFSFPFGGSFWPRHLVRCVTTVVLLSWSSRRQVDAVQWGSNSTAPMFYRPEADAGGPHPSWDATWLHSSSPRLLHRNDVNDAPERWWTWGECNGYTTPVSWFHWFSFMLVAFFLYALICFHFPFFISRSECLAFRSSILSCFLRRFASRFLSSLTLVSRLMLMMPPFNRASCGNNNHHNNNLNSISLLIRCLLHSHARLEASMAECLSDLPHDIWFSERLLSLLSQTHSPSFFSSLAFNPSFLSGFLVLFVFVMRYCLWLRTISLFLFSSLASLSVANLFPFLHVFVDMPSFFPNFSFCSRSLYVDSLVFFCCIGFSLSAPRLPLLLAALIALSVLSFFPCFLSFPLFCFCVSRDDWGLQISLDSNQDKEERKEIKWKKEWKKSCRVSCTFDFKASTATRTDKETGERRTGQRTERKKEKPKREKKTRDGNESKGKRPRKVNSKRTGENIGFRPTPFGFLLTLSQATERKQALDWIEKIS